MTTPFDDIFGRRIEYLRLSVMDRCDPRCCYWLLENFHDYEEPSDWLTLDKFKRVTGCLDDGKAYEVAWLL